MNRIIHWKTACAPLLLYLTAAALPAQNFTTLANFDGANGDKANGSLEQGANGNFYGTTYSGGTNRRGAIFEVTPAGGLKKLYNFCAKASCSDGQSPYAGLLLASNGNFYGTTRLGGANGLGTVFSITPSGKFTTLYNFGGADGSLPNAGLLEGSNGNFYGTTSHGGAQGSGSIFELSPTGALTTLYSFCLVPNCTDGATPWGGLAQGTDGNYYGTTYSGGNGGLGTIFKITPKGTLRTLFRFSGRNGSNPTAGLIEARPDKHFYGTTSTGGNSGNCTGGCGIIFKITPGGLLSVLHQFDGADGSAPGLLIQATDGNLYGSTLLGGSSTACVNGCGAIFQITTAGALTTLYDFDFTSGANPSGGLVQGTDGNFYGATAAGGSNSLCAAPLGCGTVFSFSEGLAPFLKTLPHSGKVGTAVAILGSALTGATSVTFNGAPAEFNVVSDTEIATIVPPGATTGKVAVTTPSGALSTAGPFVVR